MTTIGAISAVGFDLHPWQQAAVQAWTAGDSGRPNTGTLEVVTGGGKTLIALSCVAEAARIEPDLRVAIVVPTQALARQWRDVLVRNTNLGAGDIGLLGAGGHGDLANHRILVGVLNSAAQSLPGMVVDGNKTMLVVDECHRAGAPTFSKVLDTPARFRLGLSATPDREEVGEDGEPLRYDDQIVGRKLGRVVYRFGLKDAREAGWLPEYSLHHHAVMLSASERQRYDVVSRQVDDAADSLRDLGGEPGRSRQLARRTDNLGEAARRWVALTGQRKDLLYRAQERQRIATRLVSSLFADPRDESTPRVLLFHERVDQAIELSELLSEALRPFHVGLEHSRLPESQRASALLNFASGQSPVLVSVKSLVEGIDVPAADTGISVASTASVRQRIQALGRVLRRAADGSEKRADMHLIYVGDTVDDLIYGKTDWTDLTGADANHYWSWAEGAETPERQPGPPRIPRPTEEQAWSQLVQDRATLPALWSGDVSGGEYSVSTQGVVHNAFGSLISNPQDVPSMIKSLRGRPGGRFHVSPELSLILVWDGGQSEAGIQPYVVGRLAEPFRAAEEVGGVEDFDASSLQAGSVYGGPSDKTGGTFRISQRGGGVVERSVKRGREAADLSGVDEKAANGRAVIDGWVATGREISRFFVNAHGHAWYEARGERRFLADVRAGFGWPTDERDEHT